MTTTTFTTTPQDRYLEDFVEGDIHEFGPITITENDIIEFGKQFDPQVFHTDPDKAKKRFMEG